jgi:YVTN family beta-propeller protein
MIRRMPFVMPLLLLTLGAGALTFTGWLPTGWHLSAPPGDVAVTGTMPQGLALSPDDTLLAVVESGVNPPALRILDVRGLQEVRTIPLRDAFGTPVWVNDREVLVPGGSTNAVLAVHVRSGRIVSIPAGDFVSALARNGDGTIDEANDLGSTVMRIGAGNAQTWRTGTHPAAVLEDNKVTYVANRGESSLTVLASGESIAVDLHPAALALSPGGTRLYVACSDADAVDVISTASNTVIARIPVGLPQGRGASPNALAVAPDGTVYVSLGAQNAVAEIHGDRLVARAPTGWYPDGIAVDNRNVYVSNGKGERSPANPDFQPERRDDPEYVGSALNGSVRVIPRDAFTGESTEEVSRNLPKPAPTPPQTIVRNGGPIKHVIYIIKENRTYDQVLGDLPGADGDPNLAWFGERITPNDHAIAERFGIYDRTFTDAQVSANGHNWSTAAFANDYLERMWPPNYGGRRKLYDFEDGATASVPGTGYLWDDADAHGVSLRDYGEFVSDPSTPGGDYTTRMPGLIGHIDPRSPGFDLHVSDEYRVDVWQASYERYERDGDLPQLQIVRLPNDHTSGTYPGALTPQSYVAQNDHALGRIVDVVSHSKDWASTAIFVIEDDSQNGPDHVDDQRTTFYLISPYAAPGVHHAHYTTCSVLHTIELLLGLPPMTIYDAVAPPIYDGFALSPDLRPYDVLPERIDDTVKNRRTAYGAAESLKMDFAHADDQDPRVLNDILAHVAGHVRQ